MNNVENLVKNLDRNRELLGNLKRKEENLRRQIQQLENKISNQEFNLKNIKLNKNLEQQ